MADVVIQLGHCYRRRGSTGTAGEQQFAELAGAHAAGRLRWYGHDARIILADDPVPASDVFVAIHCDGSVYSSARGASVGWQDDDGHAIAAAWKQAYQRLGWTGGFRPDNYTPALAGYYGVRRARHAGTDHAFIVECGFLTSPDDRALLLDGEDGHARVAQAIVDAVGTHYPHSRDPTTGRTVSTERIAGDDRYDTAAQVSRRRFPDGAPVAYLASGQDFPDAIAAAGFDDGPVLLVTPDVLPVAVARELARLKPDRIVAVGGTAAISQDVLARARNAAA